MVPTKITRPSRSDPIRSQYDTERYGFFSIEYTHSQSFESGRAKQFKVREGERHNRKHYRRRYKLFTATPLDNTKLFRGKNLHKTVYLKPEPLFEDTMFNETDCEYFQDIMQWCSDPAKSEPTATDPPKKREDISHHTDTLHTTFSPQSWDVLDANSPAQAGFYTSTPNASLSPNMDRVSTFDSSFLYNSDVYEKNTQFLDSNLDILNLPVVLGNLASEETVDLNPCTVMEQYDYYNAHDNNITQNTEHTPNTHKLFLHAVDEEDSEDMKLGSVVMGEIENRDAVNNVGKTEETKSRPRHHLSLNMVSSPALWPSGAISTPEVLSYVEQMEKETFMPIVIPPPGCSSTDIETDFINSCGKASGSSAPSPDFTSVSPKRESHEESDVDDVKTYNRRRKRHDSEDSDKTYTPYSEEATGRKYKKRKPNIPIKDMILALEESQQLPKARRGRPPKRRESNISSSCSLDDNVSCASTHELKYRVIRDKNNEASKRSRMNRKLKELQMEQQAVELEERNKKLKIKADILEDMTKKLKDALMTAIIQKQT